MICNQRCLKLLLQKFMTSRRLRQWLTFFSNKYFLIKVCTFFRHNAIAHLLYYGLVETVFIYTEKSKNSCALLYCSTCFIGVV